MSCTPPIRTLTIARREPVWSTGGSGSSGLSEVFVLSSDDIAQVAPLLAQLRATLTVENRTLNASVEVVFQTTSDGVTWETAIPLSQAFVTTNTTDTTPWYTDTANFKRGIRVGVRIKQATGNAVESARVTVVLDLQLKS